MSKQQEPLHVPERKIVTPSRRSILNRSVDAALGVSVLGTFSMLAGSAEAAPQQASPSPDKREGIRRIVTGHNARGKSYVVSDTRITDFQVFWTGENPLGPGNPGDSEALMPSTMPRLDPPLGGSSSTYVHFPPHKPDTKPTWHRTMTIDYNILVSGELVLMLEEGEVTLNSPGDVVVQRNTNHAWRNASTTKPVIWVAVLVPISPRKA